MRLRIVFVLLIVGTTVATPSMSHAYHPWPCLGNPNGQHGHDPWSLSPIGADTYDGTTNPGPTNGVDVYSGLGGPDRIFGSPNESSQDLGDYLCGDNGNDPSLAGSDFIRGNSGPDQIDGGAKGDDIHGGPGGDAIWGAGGPDVINGGPSGDTIRGEDGDDTIWGDDGNDVIYGGPGYDRCFGGNGEDSYSSCEEWTQ